MSARARRHGPAPALLEASRRNAEAAVFISSNLFSGVGVFISIQPPFEMDHADLMQRFLAERERMDPRHDAFSKVLARAGVADGDSLKIEELDSLHTVYLEVVSKALRNGVQAKGGTVP